MLSLEKSFTIDGISVFRDHADANQFWYLPGPVDLARREADNRAAFTFLKYKRAARAAASSITATKANCSPNSKGKSSRNSTKCPSAESGKNSVTPATRPNKVAVT